MQNQPVARAKLAGLFWGDLPEDEALTNLRKSLANLRKLVGDYLEISRQTVSVLESAVSQTDITQFLQLAQDSTNRQALQQAATLYKGPFLEGFYLNDALEFEEWVFEAFKTI